MAASGAKETVAYDLVKSGDWKIDDIKFDGESAATADAGSGRRRRGRRRRGRSLQVETLDVQKEAADNGTRVHIKIRVTGFSVTPDGDAYRMDLAEDLETIGPDGQRSPRPQPHGPGDAARQDPAWPAAPPPSSRTRSP